MSEPLSLSPTGNRLNPLAGLGSDFERLDLSSRPFLEKSVENMVDGIEALRQDQERAEYRKR